MLVIDDEPRVRELMCDVLTTLGYDVDGAVDGAEGLVRFDRGVYDLVVTDLLMPGMSGWSVIEAIRQRAPILAVILVTGSATDADIERVRQQGVLFLQKPFRVDQFTTLVNQALSQNAP